MQYANYDDFINSPYGADFAPSGSIFATSGEVDSFLTLISALVDTYCDRTFGPQSCQDVFEGKGQRYIFLKTMPATGITAFTWETVGTMMYGASTSGNVTTPYTFLQQTGKVLLAAPLLKGFVYRVNYDAGYTTVPTSIKLATLMLANTYAQGIDTGAVAVPDGGAVTQFRFAKFMEQYSDPRQKLVQSTVGIPMTVEAILRKFRYLR